MGRNATMGLVATTSSVRVFCASRAAACWVAMTRAFSEYWLLMRQAATPAISASTTMPTASNLSVPLLIRHLPLRVVP